MNLEDNYGRKHDYLRISITDRCNLRCIYCMGEDGIKLLNHNEILTYEEIVGFVKVLSPLGLRRLRITGGEPLVRKGVENLIGSLSGIAGIEDIALTTNGELLEPMLDKLMDNGLKRVNISLDSLKPDLYKKITRVGNLDKVLKGINSALRKGLTPIKINVVLMAGVNDQEIYEFLKLTLDDPIHVRFIEYMPLDGHDQMWSKRYLPLNAVKEKAAGLGFRLNPEEGLVGNGTAETWRIHGAQGTIGFINPVSCHFCSSCTRLRLTADGKFKPCLYWQEEINVRKALKNPLVLQSLIKQGLSLKHEKHQMNAQTQGNEQGYVRSMAQIGG
ncbi:MAG: molybdenum cofactor biosynthesis protein MoeA [Clostridiaceae bacterium BRH_c20a]|nr:MAG: molybdenum cofactor biosynthesis protein MoeA [Clostridiaceae bacterium BRH_c20a]